MQIHTVQVGDTLESISKQYNIPVSKLMLDNNIPPNYILNIGQSIMVIVPSKTYIVKEGDTLNSIAETNGITFKQLIRNNPQLIENKNITTGDELVISYNTTKKISVLGYATVYIADRVLRKTLPYLTYLTIFNYKIDAYGTFADINDAEIVKTALEYGVAPIMFVSAMSETGRGSYAITHAVINNPSVQDLLIDNILINMKLKGYVGLNMGLYSVIEDDIPMYAEFVSKVTKRLNAEGYEVFVSLTPYTMRYQPGVKYDKSYFADLGAAANKVILITYQWQQESLNTVAQTTVNFIKESLDFVATQIPPEKIFIGFTSIAYDWELPYVDGETISNALTNAGALNLANQLGSVIEFDEATQTPYFYYISSGINHFVWFKDARSINAIVNLVDEYGLAGIAVWNIVYYYTQIWFVINSQYEIESVMSTDSGETT